MGERVFTNLNQEKNKLVIQVNDIDNKLPRNNWPPGKIVSTFPGKDGKVRVVNVKT